MIVEPSTYKIVGVLPRTGRSTAAAPGPAPSSHKATFSDKDRETIRKHARSSRTAHHRQQHYEYPGPDRGALAGVRGDPILPRDGLSRIPGLRDYRYIERDNRTYVIEPRERTIIEEID